MSIYLSREIDDDRENCPESPQRLPCSSSPLLNPSRVSESLRACEEVILRFRSLQAGAPELKAKAGVGRLLGANRHQRPDTDFCRPALCHARLRTHLDAGNRQ